MPNNHQNGTPAYKKIQATILKRIESGHLKAGHALTVLEREGMVQRRRGAGTFVAPPKIHFNKLMGFTELMAGRNLSACSRVLAFNVVDNEHSVAARLGLADNTALSKLTRLRLGADQPFALETCYWPAQEFTRLTRASFARGSLFSILEH